MKTVTINGRTYSTRVTCGALLRYKRLTGKEVSTLKSDDVADLVLFLCCCIVSASKADGIDCPYTPEELADLLDAEQLDDFLREETDDVKKKD